MTPITVQSTAAAKQTFVIDTQVVRDGSGYCWYTATVTDGTGRLLLTTPRRTNEERAIQDAQRKADQYLKAGGVR
jgi:hypothetical protein